MQLNDKLTPPADLSTLQRNFSFIFLSLLTESTSAVNSASSFLNSVSPGGSRLPLVTALKTVEWFTRLRSVFCLVDKYLSVFITAGSLLLFSWTSKHKERTQNLRITAYAQCSACPSSNTTHLLEGTPCTSC
ncbi:hypothetical protein AMECASPLE_036090 [Ameca splendens]|uniref:Uncharacterized protein n=1 Tax=Ameca splendens TaxID=208324 RepID=A0ABV0ZGM9_9TELE